MNAQVIGSFGFYEPAKQTIIKSRELKGRFPGLAENSDHHLTKRMREIKEKLNLTTRQLVSEIAKFESENLGKSKKVVKEVSSSYIKLNCVMMSSYLQGRVLQLQYMQAVCDRLEAFYDFKMEHRDDHRQLRHQYHNMTSVVEGWLKALDIDTDQVSPYRTLAAMVNPFYKRAVFTPMEGVFKLDELIDDDHQAYIVIDKEFDKHVYLLDPKEPVLVKDGQSLAIGDVIQYSFVISPVNGYAISQKKALNQSTFFRWYTNNTPPKSAKIIELINEAVARAVASKASSVAK